LYNRTKHHAKFEKKRWLFFILNLASRGKKTSKKSQETLMRALNYAFWMEIRPNLIPEIFYKIF